ELGQRVELQDGNERRVRGGGLDRLINGGNRLRAALRLQDGRLPEAFSAQDGRLLVAFSGLDLALLLAIRTVALRLLLTFRLPDEGTLLLICCLLQRQSVEDHLWRGDVDGLAPVEPDAPLVGHRI